MRPFSYSLSKDVDTASAELSQRASTLLGGGTCLVDLMKLYVMTPEHLIDVRKINAATIQDRGNTILISGTASNSAVAHDPIIQKEFPALSESILSGASAQLRNAATIAGNIMQRTRCPYFRDIATPCNKRQPGSGCGAIDGYNRDNAVLGGSQHCIAVNPSDMCVALAMLDTVIHVRSARGNREMPFTEFHTLPGDHPEIETILKPDEIITGIEIAKNGLARNSHYLKVRDRSSFAFALSSAAVALNTVGGMINDARLAMGGVATKPWRAVEAEKSLVGKPANADAFRAAAELALRDAHGHKYNGFKINLGKRTIIRAYEELTQA